MRSLVFGHDATVAAWASQKMGREFADAHVAVGIIDSDGVLIGAAMFQNWNGSDVELSLYGPGCLSPKIVRDLMRLAFWHLGAHRMTVRCMKGNSLRKSLPKIGFCFEGAMRCYYGPHKRHTAYVFGLLRRDAERFMGVREDVPVQNAKAA